MYNLVFSKNKFKIYSQMFIYECVYFYYFLDLPFELIIIIDVYQKVKFFFQY